MEFVMTIKIMNTWTFERDIYLIPCFRLTFIEKKPEFFFAFLTLGIYNVYNDEVDGLKEYYDQFDK
jgi:hypothetical protein